MFLGTSLNIFTLYSTESQVIYKKTYINIILSYYGAKSLKLRRLEIYLIR
jgi:hypothetical protein